MPRSPLLAILLAGLVAGALPAAASADATVNVPPNNVVFDPASVSVQKGQSVTWDFTTANFGHNIVFLPKDAPFPASNPGAAGAAFTFNVGGTATFSKSFTETGTFNYFCSLHFPAMKGTVTVTDVAPPPPPPTAPLPPEPVAVGANLSGPFSVDIAVLKGSESSFTKLTTNGAENREPAWSYDAANRQVAYEGPRADNHFSILRVDADGTDTVDLTPDGGFDNLEPSWSPDSFRIAFTSSRTGGGDIYVMDFDGTHRRRLTDDAAAERHPTFSPDGRQIAFSRDVGGVSRIMVMDVDPAGSGLGTNVHALTPADVLTQAQTEPDWSPVDANKIVFTAKRGTTQDEDPIVWDVAAGQFTPLTGSVSADEAPTWAPDGSKVMWTQRENGNQDLVIRPANGTDVVRQITKVGDDRLYATPAWQPAAKPAKARPAPPAPPAPSPSPAPGGGGEPQDTRPDPGTAPEPAPFVAIDPPHRTSLPAFRKLGLAVVVRCTALDGGTLKLTAGKKVKRKLHLPGTTLARATATCDPATKRATVLLKPGRKVARALRRVKRPLEATLRVSLSRGAATLTDKLPVRIGA